MYKKFFLNIILVLIFVLCVMLFIVFLTPNFVRSWILYYQTTLQQYNAETNEQVLDLLSVTLNKYSLLVGFGITSIVFFGLVGVFSIFMLVYVNKNDVSELAKSTKAFRQQKAEEKKQQQIRELEEKLDKMKKGE